MKLYLVQHGESASEQIDPQRPLTEKGRLDVTKTAGFLKESNVQVDRVWHSGKLRAIQTAEQMASTLSRPGICEQQEGLNPNDPVEAIVEKIKAFNDQTHLDHLMIVSHLPFVQKLAGLLLTGSASNEIVEFQQGGVVCLEQKEDHHWQLKWQIIPELVK